MSAKYLKDVEQRKTKIIHVYPNGDAYARATFVLLRLLEQKDLDRIIRAIEEKLRLPLNRPIRKLFEMSGVLVTSFIQIEDGKYYVAASAEGFMQLEYGQGPGWVRVGPVRTNKYANVQFVSRSEEEGTSKSLNSSNNMLASTKDTIKMARQKSPAKITPANIKRASKQATTSKKIMVTSEHTNRSTTLDEPREQDVPPSPEVYVPKEEDTVDVIDSLAINTNSHEDYHRRPSDDSLNVDNDDRYVGVTEEPYTRDEEIQHIEEEVYHGAAEVEGETKEGDNYSHHNEEEEKEHNSYSMHGNKEGNGDQIDDGGRFGGEDHVDEGRHWDNEEEKDNGAGLVKDGGVNDNTGYVEDGDRLDEAATKIQATYRGHRVRNELERQREDRNDSNDVNANGGDHPQEEES